MVNVFVFRDDSSTPAGWAEISSGYQERLCLCNGGGMETGGSYAHTHSTSNLSCSTAAGWIYSDYAAHLAAKGHNHPIGSITVSSEYHLPALKKFRLVYRGITGWNGAVPSGSIVFNEGIPTGWSRTESGSSYFLYIAASAGGTGGSTSHSHTASGTTGAPSATDWADNGGANSPSPNHTHTFSGTSNPTTHDYYYWACGLIKASSDSFVKVNSYLLFDGTPSSAWEIVTAANNRYLRISATDNVTTGGSYLSSTHSHSFSATTSNNSSMVQNLSMYPDVLFPTPDHNHTVSFSLASVTVQPAYVKFNLARAKINFGPSIAGNQIFLM